MSGKFVELTSRNQLKHVRVGILFFCFSKCRPFNKVSFDLITNYPILSYSAVVRTFAFDKILC